MHKAPSLAFREVPPRSTTNHTISAGQDESRQGQCFRWVCSEPGSATVRLIVIALGTPGVLLGTRGVPPDVPSALS
jgi:hypothetical protein